MRVGRERGRCVKCVQSGRDRFRLVVFRKLASHVGRKRLWQKFHDGAPVVWNTYSVRLTLGIGKSDYRGTTVWQRYRLQAL